MNAKEYLSQARHLDDIINCRLRELEYWRRMADNVSGTKLDGMPHSPTRPTEAPFVRCIEKIDEIGRNIEEKTALLINQRDEIASRIDMLDNREERLLLHYRYIDGFSWEEIERLMGLSERTAFRIHGSALAHFSVPD